MNNQKVKKLRKKYKEEIASKNAVVHDTVNLPEEKLIFNKNEFRKIKKSTRKKPLEKNKKNKSREKRIY